MFDVLMYLFKTYINSDVEIGIDKEKLTDYLIIAGFHREDIFSALNWLYKLSEYQEESMTPILVTNNTLSIRLYTDEEIKRLDTESRSFLLFLEQIQILNLKTREMVIEQIMALDIMYCNIDNLKWLILMILFNIPGCENAYQKMEYLIFDINHGILH